MPLLAALLSARAAIASEYRGQITVGGMPLPGVTVIATRPGKTLNTASDASGAYIFPSLEDGAWHVRVEMSDFTSKEEDIVVAAGQPVAHWELTMLSLDQALAPMLHELLLLLLRNFKKLTATAITKSDVNEWLELAQRISRDSSEHALEEPGLGIWGDALNRQQLVYKLASTMAIRVSWDDLLARSLNREAHESLRISSLGGYLCAWRLHLRAIPKLISHIQMSQQASARFTDGLVIGPEYGLSLCSLLDSDVMTGHLFFTYTPGDYSVESHFLEANLVRCRHKGRAVYAGPFSRQDFPLSKYRDNLYDFFLFEGVRTTKARMPAVMATEHLLRAWRSLRVGGVAYVEGVKLRVNLLNAEIWQPGPEGGITAFLRALEGMYTKEEVGDFLLLTKTTQLPSEGVCVVI